MAKYQFSILCRPTWCTNCLSTWRYKPRKGVPGVWRAGTAGGGVRP